MKAIAVQAVFLIGVIAIFMFFLIAVFIGWNNSSKIVTNQATCSAKKLSYCSSLVNQGEESTFKWDDKEPKGCDQYGISAPSSAECCKLVSGGILCK